MIHFERSIFFIFIVLIFSGNTYLTISQGIITPIATTLDPEAHPAIYEDRIVYQHYDTTSAFDIYMYDLTTGITTPICTASDDQWNPVIWENFIVWQDSRSGEWDIYMYNLLTSQEVPVCMAIRDQTNPQISDNIIVWQDYRNDNWDIYMYNIISGVETPVCTHSEDQELPVISNYRIVWQDFRSWEWDLYLYSINLDETYSVCRDAGNQTSPSLSGLRLVWVDDRYGNSDIYYSSVAGPSVYYGYNLTRDIIDNYLPAPTNQTSPKINGDRFVFIDERTGNKDLYLFEFQISYIGHVLPVMIHPDWQDWPAIYGEKVLWSDFRNGNWDIYMWKRPPGADMAITIQDEPDPVQVNEYLTYQLLIANYGPSSASGVMVTDTLSPDVELVTATASHGSCIVNGNVVTASIGNMNSNSYAGVTIVVRPLSSGTITNRVWVSANEIDDISANNTYGISTKVTELMQEPLGSGWGPSMVVDSHGHAHLTYIHKGIGGAKQVGNNWYYYWLDDVRYISNETGDWEWEIIYDGYAWNDPIQIINPHHYSKEPCLTTIAIDSIDNIHTVYVERYEERDASSMTVNMDYTVFYRKRENMVWQNPQQITKIVAVDNYTWYDREVSDLNMVVDENNIVHLFLKKYYSIAADSLHHYSNASGNWVSEVIHPLVYGDYGVALDRNNHLHLSFYSWDIIPGGLYYSGIGYLTNAPNGIWQTPEPVETNWSGGQMEGMNTEIAIDNQNRPHIVYVSGQGIPQEDVRYAYKDSLNWYSTLVAPGSFQSNRNCLVLDSNNNPHLLYVEAPSHEVKYATNVTGSWVIETFDPETLWWFAEIGMEIDRNDNLHVFLVKENYLKYFFKEHWMDNDHDGISDMEEYGPDGNNPNYDGNGDGIPDSQQENVASFHTEDGDQYITLEAPDSTVLAYTRTISKPDPNNPHTPGDHYCPYGFFQFTLFGIQAGSWVDVNLYLHGGPAIETYYKYGSTPDSTVDHWYEFTYIHPTGAVIHGDTVTLHLWDGLRGDDDLSGNGIIVEPGGPTLFVPSGLTNPNDLIPAEFALYQNYPNPFNPSTTIRYSLPRMTDVEITIYNILGQKVYSTSFKKQPAGTYQFIWDGRNSHGKTVASGMYIYQLKAGNFLKNRKMLLLR